MMEFLSYRCQHSIPRGSDQDWERRWHVAGSLQTDPTLYKNSMCSGHEGVYSNPPRSIDLVGDWHMKGLAISTNMRYRSPLASKKKSFIIWTEDTKHTVNDKIEPYWPEGDQRDHTLQPAASISAGRDKKIEDDVINVWESQVNKPSVTQATAMKLKTYVTYNTHNCCVHTTFWWYNECWPLAKKHFVWTTHVGFALSSPIPQPLSLWFYWCSSQMLEDQTAIVAAARTVAECGTAGLPWAVKLSKITKHQCTQLNIILDLYLELSSDVWFQQFWVNINSLCSLQCGSIFTCFPAMVKCRVFTLYTTIRNTIQYYIQLCALMFCYFAQLHSSRQTSSPTLGYCTSCSNNRCLIFEHLRAASIKSETQWLRYGTG